MTALPCPTSAATSSNCPAAGRSRGGSSKGSTSGSALRRTRHGKGVISSTAASKPPNCAHHGATPADHTTAGDCASQARKPPSIDTSQAPMLHSGDATAPSSAMGVMTKVTTGMATRLAARPTSDIC